MFISIINMCGSVYTSPSRKSANHLGRLEQTCSILVYFLPRNSNIYHILSVRRHLYKTAYSEVTWIFCEDGLSCAIVSHQQMNGA